jgi:hypothetical protein
MKVLMIGDIHSQFLSGFSRAITQFDPELTIDIFSSAAIKRGENESQWPWYSKIYSFTPLSPLVAYIPKLRGVVFMRKLKNALKNLNPDIAKYDVILMQGFWELNCLILSKVHRKNIFTIGAVWGSDFYKRKNSSLFFDSFDQCDLVIVSTSQVAGDIAKEKASSRNKIRNCLFGLEPLQKLFDLQVVSKTESRKMLGMLPDDFIIVCGYSGSENNQHLKVIASLAELKNSIPKQTKIIIPVTYGGTEKYKEAIKAALIATGLKYVLYERFLSDEQIAYLRKATDIMIHVPISDAFSGSFQEHLFAQNVVIAGSWLPYQLLKDREIYYETIPDVSQLKDKLKFVLQNFTRLQKKVASSNTADKFKSSLWSECIKEWYYSIRQFNG